MGRGFSAMARLGGGNGEWLWHQSVGAPFDEKKSLLLRFVYNILVAARILKEQGSTADIVVFFQLSNSYKRTDTLPEQDLQALSGLEVHIRYIPQSEQESFDDTVMDKFRILQLTQYRPVLLLDGDAMPLANLNYLFQRSDDNKFGPGNSTLKANVVVASPMEPANAGFFMLTPGEGEYERIQEVIRAREQKVQDKDGVKFDVEEGWGHTIEAPDEWVSDSRQSWSKVGLPHCLFRSRAFIPLGQVREKGFQRCLSTSRRELVSRRERQAHAGAKYDQSVP
jgi:hypothetical protein